MSFFPTGSIRFDPSIFRLVPCGGLYPHCDLRHSLLLNSIVIELDPVSVLERVRGLRRFEVSVSAVKLAPCCLTNDIDASVGRLDRIPRGLWCVI